MGVARFPKRSRVFVPSLLVKVDSEEPTGFIEQERIDADRVPAREVVVDGFVVERNVFLGLFVDAFSVLRLGGIVGLPVALCVWHVPSAAVGAFPTLRLHILASTEEGTK